MADWLTTLNKAIEDDDKGHGSKAENRNRAHALLMEEAIPALVELKATLAERSRELDITSPVKGDENPQIAVVISGAPHDPVHIAIMTMPTSSGIWATIEVGEGHTAASVGYPRRSQKIDRQSVIEAVANLYVQTIKERLAKDNNPPRPHQGTAPR